MRFDAVTPSGLDTEGGENVCERGDMPITYNTLTAPVQRGGKLFNRRMCQASKPHVPQRAGSYG